MHVDDPKGDREVMDKVELRHPSLDLILPGARRDNSGSWMANNTYSGKTAMAG